MSPRPAGNRLGGGPGSLTPSLDLSQASKGVLNFRSQMSPAQPQFSLSCFPILLAYPLLLSVPSGFGNRKGLGAPPDESGRVWGWSSPCLLLRLQRRAGLVNNSGEGRLGAFRFAVSSWVQGFCTPTPAGTPNLPSSSLPLPTGSPVQNGYGTGRGEVVGAMDEAGF